MTSSVREFSLIHVLTVKYCPVNAFYFLLCKLQIMVRHQSAGCSISVGASRRSHWDIRHCRRIVGIQVPRQPRWAPSEWLAADSREIMWPLLPRVTQSVHVSPVCTQLINHMLWHLRFILGIHFLDADFALQAQMSNQWGRIIWWDNFSPAAREIQADKTVYFKPFNTINTSFA